MNPLEGFKSEIARHIWNTKYRFREKDEVYDQDLFDTWSRIARALAQGEKEPSRWEERFFKVLENFRFLPAGRIQAGAGTHRKVTLFNCFVMGLIPDSMEGIFESLKEGALTMQQGGGVGYDFSSLRPKGTKAKSAGTIASGPLSFMRVWDSMCATLLSTGSRRGAMMATLRCDHPDVEEFISAKSHAGELTHFNLSVLVSDAFMEAVKKDEEWPLVFPAAALGFGEGVETVHRSWPGYSQGETSACRVLKKIRAKELWDKILRLSYDTAEPGVLFIDRINQLNNLWYRETISATNPCGEIPLPPYGACDLGSLNLTRFVRNPFLESAYIEWGGLEEATAVAVRLLDNVIDVSRYPLEKQREMAQGTRRIGLGITGLGDALIMLGKNYSSSEARELAARVTEKICHVAYRTSVELAHEKGAFPFFDRESYLKGEFIRHLPSDLQKAIAQQGIRNSHLMAIAPAGTISLLAGNISSGIEPVYSFHHTRNVINEEEKFSSFELTDYAFSLWKEKMGERSKPPPFFVDAHDVDPLDHLKMESALQPFVDHSISKTINIPEDYDFQSFRSLYQEAYALGLKGCTVYRPSPLRGEILKPREEKTYEPTCCPTD
jgi:ribonucleoside-diphosphate reductase alpha chain